MRSGAGELDTAAEAPGPHTSHITRIQINALNLYTEISTMSVILT